MTTPTTQPINHLATYEFATINADRNTRLVLEKYIKYLTDHPETTIIAVDHAKAAPWYYNLYGFLLSEQYAPELHWLIMVLSGLKSPDDFGATTATLTIPDYTVVSGIIAMAR